MTRLLLWLQDQRHGLVAKWHTWLLFRDGPLGDRPSKRRTP